MLEALHSRRVQQGSSIATVPNGRLWACLVSSWKKVIPDCIRNCFVEVATLPEYQKTRLRSLGVETPSDQTNCLQEELMERYAGGKEVIAYQKDFSVLNYLSMTHSEGPMRAIVELVHQIVDREEYEGTFMELNEDAFVDEDSFDDISSGDGSDSDYENMELIADGQEMQMVGHVLRNRMVVKNISPAQFSSPPSRPCLDDFYPEESPRDC